MLQGCSSEVKERLLRLVGLKVADLVDNAGMECLLKFDDVLVCINQETPVVLGEGVIPRAARWRPRVGDKCS